MKVLYIDCGMGAAGDMFTAALLDLLSDTEKEIFVNKINALSHQGVTFELSDSVKCGIKGSHVSVKIHGTEEESFDYHDHESHEHNHDHEHSHEHESSHNKEHHHAGLEDIYGIIDSFDIPEAVKKSARAVYSEMAKAEGHVHGCEVSKIHFHEVGALDAIVDITAVCMLIDHIKPDKIYASPVHVGAGKVRCAHGVLPVPTPATAFLLQDVPVYGGRIEAELCTPTGAALLKHFVNEFGNMPVMTIRATGYGMGNKDFEVCNALRIILGETKGSADSVYELSCNVDDMTPEEIGYALEVLMENGARDVFVTPVTMKKSRPGNLITVICSEDCKEKMVSLMMKHTSTLGIREKECSRYVLDRSFEDIETSYGTIRKKISTGYGVKKEKYEYDDLIRLASQNGLSLSELKKLLP